MTNTRLLIDTFVDGTAFVLALVLLVNIINRSGRGGWFYTVLMGGVFSLGVYFTMSHPFPLSNGGVYDLRGLIIGVAAGLFGPVAGAMALSVGFLMRIDIAGPGLVPGLVGMMLSFSGGLLWRYTIKNRVMATWRKSVIFGLMLTINLFAIFLTQQVFWLPLFANIGVFTVMTNLIGALVINHLISGEISFLSETEKTKTKANTDHLTGLLNRRGFNVVYPDLAKQNGHPRGRALVYFDIDNFKPINDTYGHAVGDAVLKHVSDSIASNLRPNDVFARLGGDEFAIVLNQIDNPEAKHIAERCRAVIADGGFTNEEEILNITISVGAIWMLEHSDLDQILGQADEALYAAKSKGRNKVVFKTGMALQPA